MLQWANISFCRKANSDSLASHSSPSTFLFYYFVFYIVYTEAHEIDGNDNAKELLTHVCLRS